MISFSNYTEPAAIRAHNLPASLTERPQWVLWKTINRHGKPCKVPFTVDDAFARSNGPTTWAAFDEVRRAYDRGGFEGVAYVFASNDPFVGVDLDNCRHPQTGEVAEWAREIVLALNTYAEVSPSQTGLKLVARGKSLFRGGRNMKLPDMPRIGSEDREPGVEIYDHLRVWGMTGWRLAGMPNGPQERADQIKALCERYWPPKAKSTPSYPERSTIPMDVLDRAQRYLARVPGSVAGNGGHNQAFAAACAMVIGFGLDPEHSMRLLQEWNARCEPEWSERELEHKINQAGQKPGLRGHLLTSLRHDEINQPLSLPSPTGSYAVDRATRHAIEHRLRQRRRAFA